MTGAWMSKGPAEGQSFLTSYLLRPERQSVQKAHFVRDGAPLCASAVLRDGRPAFAPFLCSWIALNPRDKLCGVCRRIEGQIRDEEP